MLTGAARFSRVFLPGRCFPDLRYHLLCLFLCSLQFCRCVSVLFSSSHLFLVWSLGYRPEYANPALSHYKKLQSRHVLLFWKPFRCHVEGPCIIHAASGDVRQWPTRFVFCGLELGSESSIASLSCK